MTLTKTCRKCGNTLPATLEYFYKNSGGKYGLTPRCKPCVNEDNIASHVKRMAKNPERTRALANARAKRAYHKNLESNRKRQREHQAARRADPEKYAVIQARKRANGAGLTPEDIDAIFTRQGHVCAICGTSDPGSKAGWNLDHCHETNKIRWILCAHCNRGLGAFKDSPEVLRKAADMLDQFNGKVF